MGSCCITEGAQLGDQWQPRGWDGVEGGREVQKGGDMCRPMADYVVVWQTPTKYCKTIILQWTNFLKKEGHKTKERLKKIYFSILTKFRLLKITLSHI